MYWWGILLWYIGSTITPNTIVCVCFLLLYICIFFFVLFDFVRLMYIYIYICHNIIYVCLLMAKSMFSADFANNLWNFETIEGYMHSNNMVISFIISTFMHMFEHIMSSRQHVCIPECAFIWNNMILIVFSSHTHLNNFHILTSCSSKYVITKINTYSIT